MKQLIVSAQEELDKLGTSPSSMTPKALLADIGAKLKHAWPAAPVLQGFSDVTYARNSREAAEQAATITADFERRLDFLLDTTKPQNLLCAPEVDAAIGRAFDDVLPLRLARFSKAKDMLREAAREALVARYELRSDAMKLNAMAELRIALRGSRGPGAVADVAAGMITEAMYECVFPAMQLATKLSADVRSEWVKTRAAALLTESAEHAEARKRASRKVAQLHDALAIVSGIERHVNAVDSADAAGENEGAGGGAASGAASAGQKRSRAVVQTTW